MMNIDDILYLSNSSNNSGTITADKNGHIPAEDLLATLLQIFLTIKLGWVSGLFKIIDKKQTRGLDIFVGKYALPVLIFTSLARLNFEEVEWSFLIGIAITKASVFIIVFLAEYLLHSPRNFSRPSIFAILCTQTNDFGMGLPILQSVYGSDHKYIGLLYLVGPISLLILNPIGFTFLETEKSVAQGQNSKGIKNKLKIFVKIVRGLLMNPIVSCTLLGVVANFALDKKLPSTLDKFLGAIGMTFTSLAPFTLGLNMVGKLGNLRGGTLKTITGLLVMKGLATPLLCHIVIEQAGKMLSGVSDPGLSNFGVLYGFIPPALGVDSYASLYNVNPELVSGSIVIITIFSAPMMYLSANILKVLDLANLDLNEDLKLYLFNISTFSVVGVVIILMIFIASKRFKRIPHMLTFSLLIFGLEAGIGGIMKSKIVADDNSTLKYVEVFLSNHGIYCSKFCVTTLSIVLYLVVTAQTKKLEKFKFGVVLISPVLGAIITCGLMVAYGTKFGPYLNNESSQEVLDLSLDVICFILMIFFLAKSKRSDDFYREQSCDCMPYKISKCGGKVNEYSPQIFRHFLLLILYCGSMFSNLTLNLFRISDYFHEGMAPGLYKVLLYIDIFMWTGQGFILAGVFGLDCTYIISPLFHFLSWMKTLISGRNRTFSISSSTPTESSDNRKVSTVTTITVDSTDLH